jgi:hypothetical protein
MIRVSAVRNSTRKRNDLYVINLKKCIFHMRFYVLKAVMVF